MGEHIVRPIPSRAHMMTWTRGGRCRNMRVRTMHRRGIERKPGANIGPPCRPRPRPTAWSSVGHVITGGATTRMQKRNGANQVQASHAARERDASSSRSKAWWQKPSKRTRQFHRKYFWQCMGTLHPLHTGKFDIFASDMLLTWKSP